MPIFLKSHFNKISLISRAFSMAPPMKEIKVEDKQNGVFHVQLNRPENRNSFTLELWEELHQVFDHLAENSHCRSIVLSGNGKSFCSGIDLKNGLKSIVDIINDKSDDSARKSRKIRGVIQICQRSYSSLEKCPKPVIAAIHGHCIGAGISLASCCDIRYAVNDSLFSIREIDIGLAADVGILQRIQKIVGNDSWGRELAYTARDFTGCEGLDYGFISKIYKNEEECLDAALKTASKIASKSPIAVQGSKLAMNYARDHSIDDSLEWMLNWNQSQLATNDILQNIAAKTTKTEAKFDDV